MYIYIVNFSMYIHTSVYRMILLVTCVDIKALLDYEGIVD